MADVDKKDIKDLHDKIDGIALMVTAIKTKQDLAFRPCPELKAHFLEHEKWGSPIRKAIVDLVKLAVVAAVTFFIAKGGM